MVSWHFVEVTGNLLFNHQLIQQHQDSKVKINAFFTLDSIFFCLDPYVRISFGTQSQVSEIIHRTLCPTWDQTLIFENVYIYGSPEITEASPPRVVLELFDQDPVVRRL